MLIKSVRLRLLGKLVFQLLVLVCLLSSNLQAQPTGGYKIHAVTAGETFKSIAEIYHLNAEELADYNNLDFYEGPLVSKTLRIPLKTTKAAPKKEVIVKDVVTTKKVKNDIVSEPPKKIEKTPEVIVTPEIHPSYNKSLTGEEKDNALRSSSDDSSASATMKSKLPAFKDIFPLLIFLVISVVLLVTGVYWYKSSSQR